MKRYIFTVTTGRSGQAKLFEIINHNFPNVLVTFEHPQVNTYFKGFLGTLERKFRRNFVETHELLGRGRVIKSFGDEKMSFINRIAKKRLKEINRNLIKQNKEVYVDISKHYIRGLHEGFKTNLDKFSIIFLVRDPIENMKSFLNRNKNFNLDNGKVDANSNIFKLENKNLEKGELYLWAWFEYYLRYLKILEDKKIDKSILIETSKLNDKSYLKSKLEMLDLKSEKLTFDDDTAKSSNLEQGYEKTKVTNDDIKIYKKFIKKVPNNILEKIKFLNGYDPSKIHNLKL
tara:strand:+ start:6937 stop:7800 length:864 start_codon:yes stop_codon:yes gene_type:complete